MPSPISRSLTYLLAALYALTGAVLWLFPEQLAPVFAWKVSPFVTMTIGGWCLGNAWLAWVNARRWQWGLIYTSLLYLWTFGVLEAGVLLVFRANLKLGHPIAWLYLATLVINLLGAIAGFADWLRLHPKPLASGPAAPRSAWFATLAFLLFVGFLGLYGLFAPNGAAGTRGGIFPEVMSNFTLRSFGAFYFALAITVAPLLGKGRNPANYLHHGFAAFGLIVFITAAAFVYIGLFDFVHRPGGLAYFGAYLIAGIPLLLVFLRFGTGDRMAPATQGARAS